MQIVIPDCNLRATTIRPPAPVTSIWIFRQLLCDLGGAGDDAEAGGGGAYAVVVGVEARFDQLDAVQLNVGDLILGQVAKGPARIAGNVPCKPLGFAPFGFDISFASRVVGMRLAFQIGVNVADNLFALVFQLPGLSLETFRETASGFLVTQRLSRIVNRNHVDLEAGLLIFLCQRNGLAVGELDRASTSGMCGADKQVVEVEALTAAADAAVQLANDVLVADQAVFLGISKRLERIVALVSERFEDRLRDLFNHLSGDLGRFHRLPDARIRGVFSEPSRDRC